MDLETMNGIFPQDWLRTRIEETVEQMEEKNLREFAEARPDLVGTDWFKPFGFCNREWEHLKSKALPGDELWEFDSGQHSFCVMAGRRGYALVRDGKSIAAVCTAMS